MIESFNYTQFSHNLLNKQEIVGETFIKNGRNSAENFLNSSEKIIKFEDLEKSLTTAKKIQHVTLNIFKSILLTLATPLAIVANVGAFLLCFAVPHQTPLFGHRFIYHPNNPFSDWTLVGIAKQRFGTTYQAQIDNETEQLTIHKLNLKEIHKELQLQLTEKLPNQLLDAETQIHQLKKSLTKQAEEQKNKIDEGTADFKELDSQAQKLRSLVEERNKIVKKLETLPNILAV